MNTCQTDIRIPYAQLQRFMTVAMERLGLPSSNAATVGKLIKDAVIKSE